MPTQRRLKTALWILALLTVFAGQALASDSATPAHVRNRLDSYVQTKYYKKKLYDASTALAVTKYSCPEPGFKIQRKHLKVMSPVSFKKGELHPYKGIWFENDDVALCGRVAHVMVTVMSHEDAEPDFAAEFTSK